MRILTSAAVALAVALLAASPGTAGKGGPSPDPLFGWDGVVSPSGAVRYVTLPARDATTVAGVRVRDGRVLRYATVRGLVGIPQVTWDGTTDGISANGQKLVLASFTSRPLGLRTTFVVLRANSLALQARGFDRADMCRLACPSPRVDPPQWNHCRKGFLEQSEGV